MSVQNDSRPTPRASHAVAARTPDGNLFGALKIVVLSDGRPGSFNQSLGVAAALGERDPEVLLFPPLHKLRAWLPVTWLHPQDRLDRLAVADIVVAAGWQVSRIARWSRRMQARLGRTVFTVQMMLPSGRPEDYDLVAVPWHDAQKERGRRWTSGAANVVVTSLSANLVTPGRLNREAERWEERLCHLPPPLLTVLIGGKSRHRSLSPASVMRLIDEAVSWAAGSHGSLLVSASRRTGADISDMIATRLTKAARIAPSYFWRPDDPDQPDDPYMAYLERADAIVVTDDSMSMISEAITTAKPVYRFGDDARASEKARALFAKLEQEGRLARWNGQLTLRPPVDYLPDAELIAAFVRAGWEAAARRRADPASR